MEEKLTELSDSLNDVSLRQEVFFREMRGDLRSLKRAVYNLEQDRESDKLDKQLDNSGLQTKIELMRVKRAISSLELKYSLRSGADLAID